MITELQLVLEPYFEGCHFSHLLFKICRCDNAVGMVWDFFQKYFHKEARKDKRYRTAKSIAQAVMEEQSLPPRCEPDSG